MVSGNQGGLKNVTVTELNPTVEVHPLEDGAEIVRALSAALAVTYLLAEVVRVRLGLVVGRVLDVEDGFARVDELVECLALRVLRVGGALLVDGEVDQVHHVVDDVGRVLETNRHVVFAGLVVEELHVVN